MRPSFFSALAAVALLAAAVPAHAQAVQNPYLLAAMRLYGDVEYEAALSQLERAKNSPDISAAELVQVHVYTGLIKCDLGDWEEGRAAFRIALALDPEASLPRETSPKIRAEWMAIKAEVARVKVPAPQLAQPAPNPQPASATPPAPSPPASVDLQPTQATVASKPADQALAPSSTVTSKAPAASSSSPVPFIMLGGAAALGSAGGVFGYLSHQASAKESAEPVQLNVAALDQTAHQRATVANALYVSAGVVAVVGAIWLLAR